MSLYFLLACPVVPEDVDSSDTSSPGDTADSGDTATDDGDVANDVLVEVAVADRSEGFDLDGDGRVDNALWYTKNLVDPLIEERLLYASNVAVLQLSGIDGWTDDAVRVGLFNAVDADGDGADNASGDEVVEAGAAVDGDGLALVGVPTGLVGGAYEVELGTNELLIGTFEFELATGVFVSAVATPDGQSGLIGGAISTEAFEAALDATEADGEVIEAALNHADLDLDGNGENDALSMAFEFSAAPVLLSSP